MSLMRLCGSLSLRGVYGGWPRTRQGSAAPRRMIVLSGRSTSGSFGHTASVLFSGASKQPAQGQPGRARMDFGRPQNRKIVLRSIGPQQAAVSSRQKLRGLLLKLRWQSFGQAIALRLGIAWLEWLERQCASANLQLPNHCGEQRTVCCISDI